MGAGVLGRQENCSEGCCTADRTDNHFPFEHAHGVDVDQPVLTEVGVVAPEGCQIGLGEGGGVLRFRVDVVEIVAVDEDMGNVRMPQLVGDFVSDGGLANAGPSADQQDLRGYCFHRLILAGAYSKSVRKSTCADPAVNNRLMTHFALLARDKVLATASVRGIRIVGSDGPSIAGKSTFARQLASLLDAPVIQIDDFVSWNNLAGWWPRFDHQVLDPLLQGRPARYQQRDWDGDEFGDSLGAWATVT